MKTIIALAALLLCGCSYSKPIKGTNLRAVHIGGVLRPGITMIVTDPGETNLPGIVTQASGPAVAGNILGTATGTIAGFFAGYGVGKSADDTTTVIQGEPRAGPIIPPTPPPTSSRPPFGPPPWKGKSPHNQGR